MIIPKQQILKGKNYKPKFLLAWAKFLTYNELEKVDQLEPYDADIAKQLIKNQSEWDKNVIQYNEDNLKKALCIAMSQAYKDLYFNNALMSDIYSNDILTWLYILGNKTIKLKNKAEIENFYNNISVYYKFEIPEKLNK